MKFPGLYEMRREGLSEVSTQESTNFAPSGSRRWAGEAGGVGVTLQLSNLWRERLRARDRSECCRRRGGVTSSGTSAWARWGVQGLLAGLSLAGPNVH